MNFVKCYDRLINFKTENDSLKRKECFQIYGTFHFDFTNFMKTLDKLSHENVLVEVINNHYITTTNQTTLLSVRCLINFIKIA